MVCTVYQLGLIAYSEAYHLQTKLLYQRARGKIKDTLVLLEHPPTITIGKSGKMENVLASKSQLSKEGISVLLVDRGGDVTYHGPGQLVGYPIIDLKNRGKDVHRYVYDLEDVILRTISDFGLKCSRDIAHAGVWAEEEEIAAIGLKIRWWISMHGFALNVTPELKHFSFINPCGFANRKATSMSKLLSQDVPMESVIERLLAQFSHVFNTSIELGSDMLVWSCR